MKFIYKETKVHYEVSGNGEKTYVFLHGWGASAHAFDAVENSFIGKKIKIDLPPFGESSIPYDFTIYAYADMIKCLLEHMGISKAIIVAHSFGGRIALILGGRYENIVEKLILVDSAGLKPKRKLSYYFKVWYTKVAKKLKIKSNFGSSDYKKVEPEMREVFKNIVSTHLDYLLPKIKVPTLIIFGENDRDTPIYMAKRLHKGLKNSKLVILKKAGHFSYLDNSIKFGREVKLFLEE